MERQTRNKPRRRKKELFKDPFLLSRKLPPFSLRKGSLFSGRCGVWVIDPFLWFAQRIRIIGQLDWVSGWQGLFLTYFLVISNANRNAIHTTDTKYALIELLKIVGISSTSKEWWKIYPHLNIFISQIALFWWQTIPVHLWSIIPLIITIIG